MAKKITSVPKIDAIKQMVLFDEIDEVDKKEDYTKHVDCLVEDIWDNNPNIGTFVVKHCSRVDPYSTTLYTVLLLYRSLKYSGEIPIVSEETISEVKDELDSFGLESFIKKNQVKILKSDPTFFKMMNRFCQSSDNPDVAIYTTLIMYRSLDKQAENNRKNMNYKGS